MSKKSHISEVLIYLFAAAKQTSTAKLPAFFQIFKLKHVLYRLMKQRLILKMLLIDIIFESKTTIHIIAKEP